MVSSMRLHLCKMSPFLSEPISRKQNNPVLPPSRKFSLPPEKKPHLTKDSTADKIQKTSGLLSQSDSCSAAAKEFLKTSKISNSQSLPRSGWCIISPLILFVSKQIIKKLKLSRSNGCVAKNSSIYENSFFLFLIHVLALPTPIFPFLSSLFLLLCLACNRYYLFVYV